MKIVKENKAVIKYADLKQGDVFSFAGRITDTDPRLKTDEGYVNLADACHLSASAADYYADTEVVLLDALLTVRR